MDDTPKGSDARRASRVRAPRSLDTWPKAFAVPMRRLRKKEHVPVLVIPRRRFPRPLVQTALAAPLLLMLSNGPGPAQEIGRDAGLNTYGYPGLIDMPTATSREDAELAFTASHFRNQTRNTLTFQLTPKLSGSFRYSSLYSVRPTVGSPPREFFFDRSFSVHYRIFDEGARWPAVAVGLNDFLGSGVYSSEYIVASKRLSNRLRATGGIGWGRLGSKNGFENPLRVFGDRFQNRPKLDRGEGGQIETGNWFRGNTAFFGGVEYQATERLRLIAEYSSDAYPNEDDAAFDWQSPFNFGLKYDLRPGVTLGVNYLYG